MRRILLVALLGTAVVAVPTSTAEAKAKPTFKVGTYKAKAGTQEFKISLKPRSAAAGCSSASRYRSR